MSLLFATLLLASAPAPPAEVRAREVPVAVSTRDGSPVDDLKGSEIEIKEDGKKRPVLGVRRDQRPVDVALILDSSQWMSDDYRTILVPAAMDFWRALPPEARLTVWTCGGRVSRVADFGVEPESAEASLQMQAVGGPVFALDAIIDASLHLQQEGRERRVVVIVTSVSIPFSKTLIDRTYRAIPEARVTPVVVLVNASGTGGGVRVGGEGRSWDVESVLEDMADGYGGGYDLVLTTQAVGKMLSRAAADISSQYLVRFESEAEKPGSPEVKVKRKGVRARAGMARIAH